MKTDPALEVPIEFVQVCDEPGQPVRFVSSSTGNELRLSLVNIDRRRLTSMEIRGLDENQDPIPAARRAATLPAPSGSPATNPSPFQTWTLILFD